MARIFRLRGLVAGTVALALLLAGCIGSSQQDSAPVAPASADSNAQDPVADAASGATETVRDTTKDVSAAKESSGTAWLKTYWGQQQQIVIAEATGPVFRYLTTSATGCVFFPCGGVFVEGQAGKIIAPGTESVEVSVSYTPPPTAPGSTVIYVDYMTAAGGDVQTAEMGLDETLVIKVGEKDLDAPLQKKSHWWFWVRPVGDPAASYPPTSDMTVKVVAKRGASIPEVPEATEPWGAATSLKLIQGESRDFLLLTADPVFGGFFFTMNGNGWGIEKGIIPPGAKKILAKLSWTGTGTAKPYLNYWWSEDNNGELTMLQDGEMERTFELAVPEKLADSPYQKRSVWGFWYAQDGGAAPAGAIASGAITLDLEVVK